MKSLRIPRYQKRQDAQILKVKIATISDEAPERLVVRDSSGIQSDFKLQAQISKYKQMRIYLEP